MAFSKHFLYNQEFQLLSSYARSLGFPGRPEILLKLHLEGPLCVQALAEGHPISRESLSGHLKILREAHLVVAEERFPFTFYHLHEQNMEKAEDVLNSFFKKFKEG
jgi:DNA-binding transcriptional ArsR family regulator